MRTEVKYFSSFKPENFERLATHPYFKDTYEAILKKSEYYMANDPPVFKFSGTHAYYVTGRAGPGIVHSEYFDRMMNHFFMYVHKREEKYLTALMNIIWNICDLEAWDTTGSLINEEMTLERRKWALCLHCLPLAGHLAQIIYILEDELPELVVRRARHELRLRVIDPFNSTTDKDFWWMRATNNWAPVCAYGLLFTYFYAAEPDETEAQLPRIVQYLHNYLSAFDDEGCCYEGYHYWKLGMWSFCLAQEVLYEYTEGKINLFDIPKFHKMAQFQQNAAINETEAIPFGDCSLDFLTSPTLSHKLKTVYPDIQIPPTKPAAAGEADFRPIFWLNPEFANSKMKPKSAYYAGAQWFIHRDENYSIACKAGHNGEYHNHNDVGSFVISKNGKSTFTEGAGGLYTSQYMRPETRYDHMLASSRGHSAPIINGQYEVTGKDMCEVLIATDDEFSFNMQTAYGIDTLKTLNRHFVCKPDGITLTDTYDFSEKPESVTERFISIKPPKITDEGVMVGDSILTFDKSVFDVEVGYEIVQYKHKYHKIDMEQDEDGKGPLYYTDLKAKNLAPHMELTVKFI